MLRVYIGHNVVNQKICTLSDVWFNSRMYEIDFDADVQKIINQVDQVDLVEHVGNLKCIGITSKFIKDALLSVEELSTGCKTVINVYSFPEMIFSAAGCGDNALQVLFQLKRGNVYLPYFIVPKDFHNDIEVILDNNEKKIIHDNEELLDILDTVYAFE